MYLYLVSTPAQPWQVHDTTLATIITSLLTILFTNGSQTNVDIAAQKLKVNLAKQIHTGILALSSFKNPRFLLLKSNCLI